MRVKSYRQLLVWQRAMDLLCAAYGICKSFPSYETHGLASQIRRAAVSVVANIAEGHSRAHRKEFLHFLSIARGSQKELESLLAVAERLGYVTPVEVSGALVLSEEVSKMLVAMHARLSSV